jgi:hypothetical protein
MAERRRAHSVAHAGLEVEEHRAGYVNAARGLVVKLVDAAELRVVVAALLAVAADAVLVAHHHQKLGAHLVTALARLHGHNLVQKRTLEAGTTREKGRSGAEMHKKLRVAVLHGKQGISGGARAYPERENEVVLPLKLTEIFVLATCTWQFSKASSAATLSQQEKNN